MHGILTFLTESYQENMASGDPRVTKWFLMNGPGPTLTLVGLYLLLVIFIGPAWMRNRKPFDLKYAMLVYNMAIVAMNIYLISQSLKSLLTTLDKGLCRKESPTDPDSIVIAKVAWWFYFIKFVEFADTFFFVLRKKFQNISKLHVLHHAIVPIACWGGIRMEPASYNYFGPLINSTVHAIMYTYYGLSALGPNAQKYLWWKKYLTMIQMLQFVMIILYMMLILNNCVASKFVILMNLIPVVIFLPLFYDFYQKTYTKKSAKRKQLKLADSSTQKCTVKTPETGKLATSVNSGVHEPTDKMKKIT